MATGDRGCLAGNTLAVLGLGNIGAEVTRIGLAFRMRVVAWSQNLTAGACRRGRWMGAAFRKTPDS